MMSTKVPEDGEMVMDSSCSWKRGAAGSIPKRTNSFISSIITFKSLITIILSQNFYLFICIQETCFPGYILVVKVLILQPAKRFTCDPRGKSIRHVLSSHSDDMCSQTVTCQMKSRKIKSEIRVKPVNDLSCLISKLQEPENGLTLCCTNSVFSRFFIYIPKQAFIVY